MTLRSLDPEPELITTEPVPSYRARAVLLVVLVAALTALAASDAVHQALLRVFDAARVIIGGHPVLGPLVFVLLAALSAMLAFFSSAVLVAPAVYAWGPTVTALLLWLGWMLGGATSYALAYSLGRPVLRWLAPGRSFAAFEEHITKRASFGFVLLFQLALPSEIPGYVLGLVRYAPGHYLAALAIAELPYAVGTMLLGESFVERRIALLISLGAVAAVTGVLLARALRRRMA
jgi:uncharacterized membrane protein YdjX (TVP38/TMEM64 family)